MDLVKGDFNMALEMSVTPSTGADVKGKSIVQNDGSGSIGPSLLAAALRDSAGSCFGTRIKWAAGTLADASKDYDLRAGFASNGAPATWCSGNVCVYLHSQASGTFAGNWTCTTTDGSGTTEQDCGVAPVSGTWQKLKVCSIAGPGFRCSVDSTNCPDITTHVSGWTSTDLVGPSVMFEAIHSTENKKVYIDYVKVHQVTSR